MKYLSFILLILLPICLFAQNNKRAFKSLEKADYEKAKELFDKALSEDSQNVAANFGMAMIKADDKSPFFDIIESWKYIEAIKGKENNLSQEDIETLTEYFLNTEVRKTNRPVKKKIEIAIDAVEARLIKYIREENNLEAVYRVLELYPNFKHYDNVMHIRNQFEYRKYEKLNTLEAYEDFIKKFPNAAQIPKAEKNRNKLAFEAVKLQNTVTSYNNYIKQFPNSEYLQQTIKLRNALAFSETSKSNTLEAFEQFIKNYPDALEIADARKKQHQLMYEKAKRIKTLEAYNEFISLYPDGAYYLDVFNLKAGELGMQDFRQLGFDSPDFKWAKAFDNNQQKETARSIALTSDGGYIVAGTTTNAESDYTDTWVIKLDNQGKMVWNKTVGQAFNDDLLNILVTAKDEVIGIGYTQIAADSNSTMGWMFKLGKDGSKQWNKNIGKVTIAASAISADNSIYLSTYESDTIPDNYNLQAFDLQGTKVWERKYTKTGTFNDLAFTAGGPVFLAGSRWIAYTDPKFYISWEDTLMYPGTIKLCDLNKQYIILSASDSLNRYQLVYSLGGQKVWKNIVACTDKSELVSDILINDLNQYLLASSYSYGSNIICYDSKGNVLKEKKLYSEKFKLVKMLKDNTGGITYLFEGDDILVVSCSSVGF